VNKDWKCPCCFNECSCNQCKKNWIKIQNSENYNYKVNHNEETINHKNEKKENIFFEKNKKINRINYCINLYNDKVFPVDNNNLIVSKDICVLEDSGLGKNLNKSSKNLDDKGNEFCDNFNQDYFINEKTEDEKFYFVNDENNNNYINLSKDNCRSFSIYQDKNKIDNKIMKIIEKKTINTKARNEYIPESMFLNLKRLREEYTKEYEKYKDSTKL